MGLRTDQLDFRLDPALVAARPASPRDSARMLVVNLPPAAADDGRAFDLEHRRITDLPAMLGPGDRLVLNETRVVPARIRGLRVDTGGGIDGLLAESDGVGRWWAMLRKSRRLRSGHEIDVLDDAGGPTGFRLRVERSDAAGRVLVALRDLRGDGSADPLVDHATVEAFRAAAGAIPLPPYIIHARRDLGLPESDPQDRDWYQTTFAAVDDPTASVAAPTAGLHLTDEVRRRLGERGVEEIRISLEVGAGTFKPVEADDLDQHRMHEERCLVTPKAVAAIARAEADRAAGKGRMVAVGTTAVRTLESMAAIDRMPAPVDGRHEWRTDLLIQPGHRFRRVDAMLTNFHLPRSTLLALVAAMAGLDRIRAIYELAVEARYRFFSYGDAMFVNRRID